MLAWYSRGTRWGLAHRYLKTKDTMTVGSVGVIRVGIWCRRGQVRWPQVVRPQVWRLLGWGGGRSDVIEPWARGIARRQRNASDDWVRFTIPTWSASCIMRSFSCRTANNAYTSLIIIIVTSHDKHYDGPQSISKTSLGKILYQIVCFY